MTGSAANTRAAAAMPASLTSPTPQAAARCTRCRAEGIGADTGSATSRLEPVGSSTAS